MKSIIIRIFVFATLYTFTMCVYFINCSGSDKPAGNSDKEVVASDNFNIMMRQLDKAMANGNYAFAFKVLNSIPSHFDDYSQFYYNPYSGKMGDFDSHVGITEKYTYQQYCQKAVSLLEAECDVLLMKDDPEAENLFLEHLADFDLGVNKVNIGTFYYAHTESKKNKKYQEAVTIYNDYLISVIRKAMLKNKPELAKKISLLVRDGLSFFPIDHDYIWDYDTEAKDEAQEIIDSFTEQ